MRNLACGSPAPTTLNLLCRGSFQDGLLYWHGVERKRALIAPTAVIE